MRFFLLLVCVIALGCGSGESERLAKVANERARLEAIEKEIADNESYMEQSLSDFIGLEMQVASGRTIAKTESNSAEFDRFVEKLSADTSKQESRLNAIKKKVTEIMRESKKSILGNIRSLEQNGIATYDGPAIEDIVRKADAEYAKCAVAEHDLLTGYRDHLKNTFPYKGETDLPPKPDVTALEKAALDAYASASATLDGMLATVMKKSD